MTSAVASGHLSPSVHAYGCSTVTALLCISQASCSTFLDRGKSSLWLEANNFIPGASKSQAKGQGLGQQLGSLANIFYQYSFARICSPDWVEECDLLLWERRHLETTNKWPWAWVIQGQNHRGWKWPFKIVMSTPPSAHSGTTTAARFMSRWFMCITRNGNSTEFLGKLPGQSITCH